MFKPLDVVYKPLSKIDQTVNCYFSKSTRNAYQLLKNKGKHGIELLTADQYFAYNNFFAQKKLLKNHMNSCSSMSGIVYKFKYQNILSFEDNVKFMGDVYFAIYCNIATICRKTSMIFQKTFQCIQSPMPLLLSFTQTLGLKKIFC